MLKENKKSGLNITIKEGVSFWIGDAEVRINAARKGYVRLSVIAPKTIIVNRHDPKLKEQNGNLGENIRNEESLDLESRPCEMGSGEK